MVLVPRERSKPQERGKIDHRTKLLDIDKNEIKNENSTLGLEKEKKHLFSQRLTERILDTFVDQKESEIKSDLG